MSYGYGFINARKYGDKSIETHNIGAKFRFLDENSFDTAWVPALAVGGVWKYTDSKTVDALGLDDNGYDAYVVASKLITQTPVPALRGISSALATPMAARLNTFYLNCGAPKFKLPRAALSGVKIWYNRSMDMKTIRRFLFAAAAAFAAVCTAAEPGPMASALAPYLDDGRLPGAIAILVKPGVESVETLGWADVSNRVPMALDRMFQQCSQTKGFCGVTVAMLVEEGRLNLDDPVEKYLGEFSNLTVRVKHEGAGDTFTNAVNKLTVRMCMNHTGGFDFEIPTKNRLGWAGLSLDDTAREAAREPLLFEPGTRVRYSNTGIDVAAAVVAKVAGMPWEAFLQTRVLDPLGMADTTFWPTDEQIARRIRHYAPVKDAPAQEKPYERRLPPPWNGPGVFPSAGAGLWTTAADQLKFYRMLMNGGVGENGVRLLKRWAALRSASKSRRTAGSGTAAPGTPTRRSIAASASFSSGRCSC